MNLRIVLPMCTLHRFLPQMKGHFKGLPEPPPSPFFICFAAKPDCSHHAKPLDQPFYPPRHPHPSHRMEPCRTGCFPRYPVQCLGLQPVLRPACRPAFDRPAGGISRSAVCGVIRRAGAALVDSGRLLLCHSGVLVGGAFLRPRPRQRLPRGWPGTDHHVHAALSASTCRCPGVAGGSG